MSLCCTRRKSQVRQMHKRATRNEELSESMTICIYSHAGVRVRLSFGGKWGRNKSDFQQKSIFEIRRRRVRARLRKQCQTLVQQHLARACTKTHVNNQTNKPNAPFHLKAPPAQHAQEAMQNWSSQSSSFSAAKEHVRLSSTPRQQNVTSAHNNEDQSKINVCQNES